MFRVAATALMLALSTGVARAETLGDVLVSAYRNSNLLEQNRAVLRAADEDVAQSMASLRPVIDLVASATYVNGRSYSDSLTASLSLTGQITLYDFGRSKASTLAAKETVLATRRALQSLEQTVLLTAVQAYASVRLQQDAVSLREANVRLINQELRAARDRFEVGEITRTDVAIAESQLALSQSLLAQAQGDLAVARETFKLAVGNYPRALAAPPRSPQIPRTLEEARAIALRTHPDILQLQHEVAAAEANVKRANANFGPTLNGQATLSDGNNNDDTLSLTLSLNQRIYSGGTRSSLYRQALARRDIARARLQQAGIVVAQGVGEAWSNLRVASVSITASDQQIRAAQIAFDGLREEAKLGARTTLEVLDAEQELLSARTQRLSAEATRYSGVYVLLASMGLLTVDHLKLGITTYDVDTYYKAVKNAPATSPQGKKLDRILKSIGKN